VMVTGGRGLTIGRAFHRGVRSGVCRSPAAPSENHFLHSPPPTVSRLKHVAWCVATPPPRRRWETYRGVAPNGSAANGSQALLTDALWVLCCFSAGFHRGYGEITSHIVLGTNRMIVADRHGWGGGGAAALLLSISIK